MLVGTTEPNGTIICCPICRFSVSISGFAYKMLLIVVPKFWEILLKVSPFLMM